MYVTWGITSHFAKHLCSENTCKIRDGTLKAGILAVTWACQVAGVCRKPVKVLSQYLLARNGSFS